MLRETFYGVFIRLCIESYCRRIKIQPRPIFRLIWSFPNNHKPTRANCHHSARGVKNWHISGNSFSTSPFTQSLLWLWLWLWFCWTQKMVWKFWLGESRACLCDHQPSHGPCASPCILTPSENFSPPSNSFENWAAIQIFERPFNSFSPSNDGTSWWKRAIARGTCGFVTVGQFLNTAQSFDNFCQTLDIFVQCLTYWFHWGFSFLSNLARHLLPVQISYQNSPKIFFRQNLNNFNRLQKFSRGSDFGTGHAITYTEHDETSHLWVARLATGNTPRSEFDGAVFDIRFHTPRNLWKRLAARRYETSK